MEMKKPSEILSEAADIIVRDGWIQGSYYVTPDYDDIYDDSHECHECDGDGDGQLVAGDNCFQVQVRLDEEASRTSPCCQYGAITRAATGYAWRSGMDESRLETRDVANEYMRLHLGASSTTAWNDEAGRTAEEVVKALKAAATLARGDGR